VRARSTTVPLALALVALLAQGCTGTSEDKPSAASASMPAPSLGGVAPHRHPEPTAPMGRLEQQVAARLARQVASQGLTLSYLDCPHWDGRVPARMTCRAYLDGLVVPVRVHLHAVVEGQAVGFDAELADGVIATRKLEETLRRQGWSDPDCGAVAAYPAVAGARIVCRVHRDGASRYVVATVANHAGRVMITDYHRQTATR
jgi:hypothetical protein